MNEPGLGQHRDLPRLGRLGRLLRPRRAAGVDRNGFGLRVPAIVISPYAKQGYIDHQILSFDAYTKFIEDDFIKSARLDPATDGRPDPRPDVREDNPILGNIVNDFDFNQTPRPPMILPVHPAPGRRPRHPGADSRLIIAAQTAATTLVGRLRRRVGGTRARISTQENCAGSARGLQTVEQPTLHVLAAVHARDLAGDERGAVGGEEVTIRATSSGRPNRRRESGSDPVEHLWDRVEHPVAMNPGATVFTVTLRVVARAFRPSPAGTGLARHRLGQPEHADFDAA